MGPADRVVRRGLQPQRGVGAALEIEYAGRGAVDVAELEPLHAAAFDRAPVDPAWWTPVLARSLGWVTARRDGELVGFVNVAWDGGVHAFLLDTVVAAAARRRGIGAALIPYAVEGARAAGCEWLHVDFEPHLRGFYLEHAGFTPTDAGTIAL